MEKTWIRKIRQTREVVQVFRSRSTGPAFVLRDTRAPIVQKMVGLAQEEVIDELREATETEAALVGGEAPSEW
jgi:hypothetical protein